MRSSLVALLLAILATDVVSAQPFESVGTRAQGMAGAFVAVADDATAVYWNPAGIPTGHFFSLLADYSKSKRRQPAGFPDSPAFDGSGTIVALSTNEIAFSYYRLLVNQVDRRPPPGSSPDLGREGQREEAVLRSVYTHNVAVTVAQLVYPGVSLGTSVRYVYGSVGIAPGIPGLSVGDLLREADRVERQGQSKFDVDIGVMIGSDTIRFGVAARNLLQPRFDTPDGGSLRLDRQVRAGLGIRTVVGLLVAVDVDLSSTRSDSVDGTRRNVALGVEHWFGQWLGIRGGARVNVEAEDPRAVGAFGVSVALMSGVYLDGHVTRGRDSIERGWGIAARVGF